MQNHLPVLFAVALLTPALSLPASAAVPPEAVELRNRGLAELENEKPELAEQAYRQLIEVAPKDPLGFGNLAIAELRQQKNEAAMASIERALEIAPGRADLLAIKSEVLQWTGDLEGAMMVMKQAADAAPEDLEILYAAYQLAATLRTEEADAAGIEVLRRLARLRPENLVVLLQLGQRAIAAGDRRIASGVFVRVEQLLWQVDPIATRALGMVTDALASDDLASARVPAIRLENVLKVSAMYRESLRELKTGIQGIPIKRFVDEPETDVFGDPLKIELGGTRLDERPTAGRALAAGDFDGDGKPDLARIRDNSDGSGTLEIRPAAGGWKVTGEHPAAQLTELLTADFDNNGTLDLAAFGPKRAMVWLGAGDGSFSEAPGALGLSQAGAAAAVMIDFDIEGDLDLAVAGGASGPADLYRNSLEGPLERVGVKSLPRLPGDEARAIAASDLDRDGDLDLVIAHARGLTWVDNLRQGRFIDASARAGLVPSAKLEAVVSADLDNDGLPDLIGGGQGLTAWHNSSGQGHGGPGVRGEHITRFESWQLPGLTTDTQISSLQAFDADNDGRLDLVTAGDAGIRVLTQQVGDAGIHFANATVADSPASATAVTAVDLDLDGDLDLAAAGPDGLHWLENRGGNRNHWLVVRLRGLDKGNSKNNFYGVGSVVEVNAGRAYQFREAAGDTVHLGIGSRSAADVLRVVWTNGVPQNRLQVEGDQRLVEEQLLKGSCPFLYAWDGSELAFVTDLLWGAPLGLPVAPGAWASSDPGELVRLNAVPADDGSYRLRITEELWEAAYFDYVRLWVVDHPEEVEVASNLRIVPGASEPAPELVLGSRDLRPIVAAWDGHGQDATAAVRHRDEVYADGYTKGRYQGVSKPWTFTFDLGEAPGKPVRLHLDGWIFPADASLNLAVAQRGDLPYLAPRLEVETKGGWQTLIPSMGHPAGKTKTMVVDTPALPPGAHKLRLVTSLWLHWDRIAWTLTPADNEPIVRARLAPTVAETRYRGFSAMVREAPNAPHSFDYQTVTAESPWQPFPGRYSRYGDVRELLHAPDDFSVILAPGDEIALAFDARDLEPPPEGFRRSLFLESHGWDKDADRNTWEGEQLEPLPFRAMTGYPFGPGESYPDTPAHQTYQREWLTREVR